MIETIGVESSTFQSLNDTATSSQIVHNLISPYYIPCQVSCKSTLPHVESTQLTRIESIESFLIKS